MYQEMKIVCLVSRRKWNAYFVEEVSAQFVNPSITRNRKSIHCVRGSIPGGCGVVLGSCACLMGACGATLTQKPPNGKLHLEQTGIRTLKKVRSQFNSFLKKSAYVIFFLNEFWHNPYGGPFAASIDHEALSAALRKDHVHRQLAWRLKYTVELKFEIRNLPLAITKWQTTILEALENGWMKRLPLIAPLRDSWQSEPLKKVTRLA